MTSINAPIPARAHSGGFAFALKRAVSQPQFLAAFTVLFVAALSLSAATQFLRLYFKKEPVALVRPLEQIPPKLGSWMQVSTDKELNPEMLDVLGTKQYIFRDYVDSREIGQDVIAKFRDMTERERANLLATTQAEHPAAVVRVSVTYYTGMVDTVAHIPDRCYVADGMTTESKDTPTWMLNVPDRGAMPLRVSLIHFEDSSATHEQVTKNVAYFFHCNGEYEFDAITGVRRRLQNLSVRHAYYAKIEIMTQLSDQKKSQAVMCDFLSNAVPEIERCLPDWKKVAAADERAAK